MFHIFIRKRKFCLLGSIRIWWSLGLWWSKVYFKWKYELWWSKGISWYLGIRWSKGNSNWKYDNFNDNPKVDGWVDGLVFVARLGSASLKVVQKHEEGQGNSWKAYITQHCATICFRWCKVLEWKHWHFYFFHHFRLT